MTAIVKSKVIVLRKIEYGDSSNILSVFSEKYGKVSVIIKGARSGRNKKSSVSDVLNLIEMVTYQKESRDVQYASQVDLINGYQNIKSNLQIYKYASAAMELIYFLIMENESHEKLFRGTVRFLDLISAGNNPKLLFSKYFLFMIEELGYKINMSECSSCKKNIGNEKSLSFNYDLGFLCKECSEEKLENNFFDPELFNLISCLSTKKMEFHYTDKLLDTVINFFENYIKYHVPEFKGLQTLKIF
jgi:DNA repair protein RecO (recombination protein O)